MKFIKVSAICNPYRQVHGKLTVQNFYQPSHCDVCIGRRLLFFPPVCDETSFSYKILCYKNKYYIYSVYYRKILHSIHIFVHNTDTCVCLRTYMSGGVVQQMSVCYACKVEQTKARVSTDVYAQRARTEAHSDARKHTSSLYGGVANDAGAACAGSSMIGGGNSGRSA